MRPPVNKKYNYSDRQQSQMAIVVKQISLMKYGTAFVKIMLLKK
jgi:hypothetical protein